MPRTKKYLGLELGGSKSVRTALVSLDFYQKENKIFISEVQQRLQGSGSQGADELLLETLNEIDAAVIAVNAPLSLAPCVTCVLPKCPGFESCKVPPVRWMREEGEREKLTGPQQPIPYTQRPLDVALRGRWRRQFAVPLEDTMGSSRGPLAVRMQYLRRRLKCKNLLEVNPRLALAALGPSYGLYPRELRRYRDVEDGIEYRASILEKLGMDLQDAERPKIFLYNTDLQSLAKDLSAFDAFVSALMALYSELGLLEAPIFNAEWGTLAIPKQTERRKTERVSLDEEL